MPSRIVLPDVNLLVYAHNEIMPQHAAARAWWTALITEQQTIAIPWVVALGFLRLVTHPSVFRDPLPVLQALERMEGWFGLANVETLEPGANHLRIMKRLVAATGATASLVTDAHLAALAIEYGCELHSNDLDFARFPGVDWRNPLQ